MSQQEKVLVITDPVHDRYSTLRQINWWEQQRLAESKVMVIGAGALGNDVLKNLALIGVGRVIVVDFDKIEAANLSRAILFRPEHYGRFKAEVAAEQLKLLNPDVEVDAYVNDVMMDVGLGVYRRMDVVIGCLDNREARMVVNKACWRVSRPWIDGGLNTLDGLVRVFTPPDGPCYECTMSTRDYELLNIRYSCPPGMKMTGNLPTTPTAASIIAGMQVQEAVKLLHGLKVESGSGRYYSGKSLRMTVVNYPRKDDCPGHETYDKIIEVPRRVDDLTVGTFLELVGATAIGLDYEVLTFFACPACRQTEKVFRPYHLVADQIECPKCGGKRLFDITFTVGASAAHISLAQLGIPKLPIIRVFRDSRWFYYELTGDAVDLRL